jgi:uncharacterized protein YuzE
MNIKYDRRADALYLKFNTEKIVTTKEKGEYLVDYDKKGEIVGIEILQYSKMAPIIESFSVNPIAARS